MGPAGRTPFTEKDDDHLVKYLAEFGSDTGRKGNQIYKQLCDNVIGLWPWANRHPWQSWRHRYNKNSDYFDHRIKKYQKQHSSSKRFNALNSKNKTIHEGNSASPGTDEEVSQLLRKRKLNTNMDKEKAGKRQRVQSEHAGGDAAGKAKGNEGKKLDRTVHANGRLRKQESVRANQPAKSRNIAGERSGQALHSKVSGTAKADDHAGQSSTSGSSAAERSGAHCSEGTKPKAPPVVEESSTEEEEEEDEAPAPRLAPAPDNNYSGQIFGSSGGDDDASAEEHEMELDPEANENSSADDNEIDHMLTDKIDVEEGFHQDMGDASSSRKDQGRKLYPAIETVPHPMTLRSDNINPAEPPSFASTATSSTAHANSHYVKPKFISRKMVSEGDRASSDAQTTAADSGFFESSSPSARNPPSAPVSASPRHEITGSTRSRDSPVPIVKTLPKIVENPFGGSHLAGTKFKSLNGAVESGDSETDSPGASKSHNQASRAPVAPVWPPLRNRKAQAAGPSLSSRRDGENKTKRDVDDNGICPSPLLPNRELESNVPGVRETPGSIRKNPSGTSDFDSRSNNKWKVANAEGQKHPVRNGNHSVQGKGKGKARAVAIVDPGDGDDEEDMESVPGEGDDEPLFTQPSQYDGPLFTQLSQYDGPLFTQASQSYPTSPPESSHANDDEMVTTEPATNEHDEEPLFAQPDSHLTRRTSQSQPDTPRRPQSTPRPLRELVSTRTAESVIKALTGFLKEVDQTREIIRQGEEEEERRRLGLEQQTEGQEDSEELEASTGEPPIKNKAGTYLDRGSPVPALMRKRSGFTSAQSLESHHSAADNFEKADRRSSHSRHVLPQPASSGERMSRVARSGKREEVPLLLADVDFDPIPHPKAVRRSEARRGTSSAARPTTKLDDHGQSSRESRKGIRDQSTREKNHQVSRVSSSSVREAAIAGPSKYTRYEEHEVVSNPDPFVHSTLARPSTLRLEPDHLRTSTKGKERAVIMSDSSKYDMNHRRYTLDRARGSIPTGLGPELDLRAPAYTQRTSRHSLPSRLSSSAASSPPPPASSFANSLSSSPIKLSASDQSRLIDANVERMARGYNFPPDYVRHIWKETEDLDEAENILRELRNMSAALLDKSRRRSSAARQVDMESSREMQSICSASRYVDARASSGSKSRHSHHRQRVSEKFTWMVTDQGFESDYSPPAVSRAGQLVRLAEQGRVEEALERERRRATITNGTLSVRRHERRRSRIRSTGSPGSSDDSVAVEDPAQKAQDNARIVQGLLDTENLDELFFSKSREGEQRAQDLNKLHGFDLMIELAVGALNKYCQ